MSAAAIFPSDVGRWHVASKMAEEGRYDDLREKYGQEFVGVLTVLSLRRFHNDNPGQWPPPSNLIPKVNSVLMSNENHSGIRNSSDIERYHGLIRKLEDDMSDAYFTCRMNYGPDLTGLALVALLRRSYQERNEMDEMELQWKVNEALGNAKLMNW